MKRCTLPVAILAVWMWFLFSTDAEDLLAGPAPIMAMQAFPLREPEPVEPRPPIPRPIEPDADEMRLSLPSRPSIELTWFAGRRPLVWIEETGERQPLFALYEDGLVTFTHYEDGARHGTELRAGIGRTAAAHFVKDIAQDGFFDMPPFDGGDTVMCGSDGRYVQIFARHGERSQFAMAYRLDHAGGSTCSPFWTDQEVGWLRGVDDRPPNYFPPPPFMRLYTCARSRSTRRTRCRSSTPMGRSSCSAFS
jgi:hypothetical protein